ACGDPHRGAPWRGFSPPGGRPEPPALTLSAAASLAAAIVASRAWRSAAPFELRAAALVLAAVLISPHVNAYDLVLLGPAVLLVAAWLEREDAGSPETRIGWPIAVLFIAPPLNSLPAVARLPLTVAAPLALLLLIRRATVEADTAVVFSRDIVAPRSECPTMALPSTSGSASAVTPARSRAKPSTTSRSASIA